MDKPATARTQSSSTTWTSAAGSPEEEHSSRVSLTSVDKGMGFNSMDPAHPAGPAQDSEASLQHHAAQENVLVCVTPGGEIRRHGESWLVEAAEDLCAECQCQVRLKGALSCNK